LGAWCAAQRSTGAVTVPLCGCGFASRTYEGLDHVGAVVDPKSPLVPDLLAWTQVRLDGTPPPAGCRTTTS
jgi:hypothetical protein